MLIRLRNAAVYLIAVLGSRCLIHACLENMDIMNIANCNQLNIGMMGIVYSFIEITSDIPHMFTIKKQVIRNTAHWPSMRSGTTMQENQQAAGGNRSRGLSSGRRDS